MRIFKLAFPILLLAAGCNKHLGTYSTLPNLSGFSYTFEKGNRFHYVYGNCFGSRKGIGTYSVERQTLEFKFEPYPGLPTVDTSFIPVQIKPLKDRVEIKILGIDEFGFPLIGCTVKAFEGKSFLKGGLTDFNGRGKLVFPWNNQPILMEVTYSGIVDIKTKILAPGIYTLNFKGTQVSDQWEKPHTRIYKVLVYNKKVLQLEPLNPDYGQAFTLHRRKK